MLELIGISKTFENSVTPAVDDATVTIGNELLTLVGPSGCGKTTTLRLIAGLESFDSGKLLYDGADLQLIPPQSRDIAFVFQEAVLYPAMSVRANLEFAARSIRDRSAIGIRVAHVAEQLQLTRFLERMPDEISGGERQRVSLGRALIRKPKILLLDEPLSNLNATMRLQLRRLIRNVFEELRIPTIYVTHDQEEALSLGDRVAVMQDGRIEQVAAPEEIYHKPANRFVASIAGYPPMNIVEQSTQLALPAFASDRSATALGFRPERTQIKADLPATNSERDFVLRGTVLQSEFVGASFLTTVRLADDTEAISITNTPFPCGDAVHVVIQQQDLHLFENERRCD